MILKRISFWVALAGVLLAIAVLVMKEQEPIAPPPLEPPPLTPYAGTVAAAGIVEAVNENVRIAPPVNGMVVEVFVAVGDQMKKQDPLFQLDPRELRARLRTRANAIPSAVASIEEQEIRLKDLMDQLRRFKAVQDRRAVSEDDVRRKWHEVEAAKRALIRAKADLKLIKTQQQETQALLERLTVRAPRSGTVLQVNIRAGEYAQGGAAQPAILLGDIETLQIRADIDEVNAPLVQPGAPAVAYLKGSTDRAIPLKFIRIEPFIVPKRSLTGDTTERVDTRVLQVIYGLEKPDFPVYVGQQVDVFIQRNDKPMEKVSLPKEENPHDE